jgi:predicted ATPase/class 3 adenylate cyclase
MPPGAPGPLGPLGPLGQPVTPAALPSGRVTFLFTDIEGSTHLLQRLGDRYAGLLDSHRRLIWDAIGAHGGREFGTQGDAVFAAFARPADAVWAALAAQRALAHHPWPPGFEIHVRMGIHTGEATIEPGGYVGLAIHEVARICSAAHGRQVVVSGTTAAAVRVSAVSLPLGATLDDLGLHRLKDLPEPLHLYQLCHPDLPEDVGGLRLDAVPGNLPKQITRFIGRQDELAEAAARLAAGRRLLTLTGSGGCGKTRLALQVAAGAVDDFPDGAWLVDLAALTEPQLVAQAVAAVLEVRDEPGRDLVDVMAEALAARRLLLVFDNCEHLLLACAELAERLLERCPGVFILATSQETLGVAGEAVIRVAPLSLPRASDPLERVAAADSVALFVDRATLTRGDFALSEANRASVASICRRLDGIPLAIELAAARVNLLSAAQIAERLDDRFRLLSGGSRTALPRHQTLRATFDWSHDLLSDPEQVLFRRLAVFAGGWTLEATDAIAGEDGPVRPESGDGHEGHEGHDGHDGRGGRDGHDGRGGDDGRGGADTLDLLDRLVSRSLVVVEEQDGASRFRLLETVRQYAAERLVTAGEMPTMRARHLAWCVTLARVAEPALTGPDQATWFHRLAAEYDNLRAAMEWAASESGGAHDLLQLAADLWRFWLVRGYWTEGREWLNRALAANDSLRDPTVARALGAAGDLATEQGDHDAAAPLLASALAVWQELDEPEGIAKGLNQLGILARERFEYDAARGLLVDALAIRRSTGNRRGMAVSLRNLGVLAFLQQDHETARALYEEALPLAREVRDKRVIASITYALAAVVAEDGDREGARLLGEEGLVLARELGDRQLIAEHLLVLAAVTGDRTLVGKALAIWEALGSRDAEPRALTTVGNLALAAGSYDEARRDFETALSGWRRLGDDMGTARLLNMAGWAAGMTGDLDAAAVFLDEAVSRCRPLGDDGLLSATLHSRGEVARHGRELATARAWFEESLAVALQSGWRRLLWWPTHGLGAVARAEGRDDEARDQLAQAVRLCPRVGRRPRLADCLEEVGWLCPPREGAVLLGAADGLREAAGAPVAPVRRAEVEAFRQGLVESLGKGPYRAAAAEGSALSVDEASARALAACGSPGQPG